MSRQTLYEWRQDAEFRRWISGEIGRLNEDDWQLVIRKHTQLALRGSVKSAHFLLGVRSLTAKLAGPAAGEDAVGDVTTNYQVRVLVRQTPPGIVNILIPRPPTLDDRE